MSFLDRLKPQPRWKHLDPAIRLEAVRDLDDPIELSALAESDSDVRVRRAALARVDDPAALARIAGQDADTQAREMAADRLVAMATRADGDSAVSFAAVRLIADPRRLSSIAKGEAPDAVRAEALARVTEPRALSSIARHARAESTALSALDRLTEHDALLEVAQTAEHRSVAFRAFDRVTSGQPTLELLRAIEARAQQKAVSRRARTMIQEIETAEAAARSAEEDRRRRETTLVEAIERLSEVADVPVARAELARLTEAWQGLGVTNPASLERFALGTTSVEANIARRLREAEEASERLRVRAEAIATRDALCARVETLDGEDVIEQLVPIEEEWRSLLPLVGNGPEADRLAERFAQVVAACRKRHEMGALLVETRASLEALVVEAETLPSQADGTRAASRWQALSREARGAASVLAGAARPDDDLAARLAAVADVFAAREAAVADAATKARQDLALQLERLGDRAKRTSESDTITLREGERLMRDIATGLERAAQAGSSGEVDEAASRLRGFQEKIAPRVRELREMDDWRRFANAQRQEQLIAMAEAIVTSLKSDEEQGKTSDLAATARALRELHAKWQEVAEAPRNTAQRLWDRFRAATDLIRTRCETYFAKMREERAASSEKRGALVTEAEALALSTDWGKAAARFQELQKEWQDLGPAGRESGRDLAHRFRAACNAFFAKRREDLADRKKTWTENLAAKEALCARAEALVESTDWEAASAEMKKMQAEWKTIGPVRRNKSETIWARFRAAADKFFERYHNRHDITLATKLAEREAMVVELEALAVSEAGAASGETVQQLRTTWNRAVPIPAAGMKPLNDRWHAALAIVVARQPDAFKGTDLDPAAVHQKMQKLVARVESFLADVRETKAGLSPTELMAAKLRSALASNAMGGRATDDAKWRTMMDAVKDAQTAWQRLAPVHDQESRALETRFREACRRVGDYARHQGVPAAPHKSARQAVMA
jgi:hypothetical protein